MSSSDDRTPMPGTGASGPPGTGGGSATDPAYPGFPPPSYAAPAPGSVGPPPAPPRARSKPAVLAALGVAAVAVLGGGGVLAYRTLASTGAQPDTVVPASAVVYARLDLDPAAGQKIAAVRFLGKVPQLQSLGSGDPREALWKALTGSDKDLAGVDFQREVAPWLGDRAGLAVLPSSGRQPDAVLALAVTDEAKATEGLTSLLARKKSNAEVTTRGGYALVLPKGKTSAYLSELDKGALATNPSYTADMAALGDQGVSSLWLDTAGVSRLPGVASAVAGADANAAQGRVAAAVRFDPSFVELAGVVRGDTRATVPQTGGVLATLPADTLGAMQVNGAGPALREQWPTLKEALDKAGVDLAEVEAELDVRLPDDLATLVGSTTTIAVPDQDFAALGRSDVPAFGMVTTGEDRAKAAGLLDSLARRAGADNYLSTKVDGQNLYVATTPGYLDTLAARGTLGDSEAFRLAVRDAGSAHGAFYVDLDRVERYYLDRVPADASPFLSALRSVGLSVRATAPGEGEFSMRLVGN